MGQCGCIVLMPETQFKMLWVLYGIIFLNGKKSSMEKLLLTFLILAKFVFPVVALI